VNPNPDLNNECVFMQAARASGRTNESTICEIAARAIERYQERANIVELPGGVNHERRPHPTKHPLAHIPKLKVADEILRLRYEKSCSMSNCRGKCCLYGADVDLAEQDKILKNTDVIRRLMDESQDRGSGKLVR